MTRMKRIGADQVVVGRVLNEDDEFMILEVAKDENRELQIREGDRFYTLIFTQGKPWGRQA